MSKYNDNNIKDLKEEDFRRLTGVKKETFNLMLKYLYEAQSKKRKSGLHKIKLTLEDKLLILLQYYRENRTFYAMAMDYNVNETTIARSIYWVEDVLAKNCNEFKLPSKRRLLDNNMEYEVFVVDATETPIERPLIKSNKKK